MKNIFLALLICCASTGSVAFAQDARMIKLSGEVLIKQAGAADFVSAQLGMPVGENAQVKTTAQGSCTISFDAKNKSLLTVKPNTSITVEGVKPGKVFLPEGRVFALIKNIKAAGKFEVRTPAAISGARGTGWSVEHLNGVTVAKCFDDVIYFGNVNDKGEIVHETEIAEGFLAEVKTDESEENKGSAEVVKDAAQVDSGVTDEIKDTADETKGAEEDVSGAATESGESVTEVNESTEPEIHQISDEDKGEWSSFMETAVDIMQENSIEMLGDVKAEESLSDPTMVAPAEGEQVTGATEEQPAADGSISDEATGDVVTGEEAIGDETISDEAISDETISDETISDEITGDSTFADPDFVSEVEQDDEQEDAAARQLEAVNQGDDVLALPAANNSTD